MSESSPWGEIQSSTLGPRGARFVTTAGHGGIMLTNAYAQEHLSEAALSRGLTTGTHYCYEEDCDFAIPIFEVEALRESFFGEEGGKDDFIDRIKESLSNYNPDYLEDVGIKLSAPVVHKRSLRKRADELRKAKDPGHVVSALGVSTTLIDNVYLVVTADDKMHYVSGDAYKRVRADEDNTILMPLDLMGKIDDSLIPPMEERIEGYLVTRAEKAREVIEEQGLKKAVNRMSHAVFDVGSAMFRAKPEGSVIDNKTLVFEKLESALEKMDPRLAKALVKHYEGKIKYRGREAEEDCALSP